MIGLAPYGKLNQELYELLSATISVQGFDCQHSSKNLFASIADLENFKRLDQDPIEKAADLAFTGQYFFAELMTKLLQHLQQQTGSKNLTLGGGCALNSAFNGQIQDRTDFPQVFIPSAPADDGTALGAAWLALHHDQPDLALANSVVKSPYLG
ncbi:nodulation protein nolNO, partial [Methylococcaceae bacterium CS3]